MFLFHKSTRNFHIDQDILYNNFDLKYSLSKNNSLKSIHFFCSLVFATPLCCAIFPQVRYVKQLEFLFSTHYLCIQSETWEGGSPGVGLARRINHSQRGNSLLANSAELEENYSASNLRDNGNDLVLEEST